MGISSSWLGGISLSAPDPDPTLYIADISFEYDSCDPDSDLFVGPTPWPEPTPELYYETPGLEPEQFYSITGWAVPTGCTAYTIQVSRTDAGATSSDIVTYDEPSNLLGLENITSPDNIYEIEITFAVVISDQTVAVSEVFKINAIKCLMVPAITITEGEILEFLVPSSTESFLFIDFSSDNGNCPYTESLAAA